MQTHSRIYSVQDENVQRGRIRGVVGGVWQQQQQQQRRRRHMQENIIQLFINDAQNPFANADY